MGGFTDDSITSNHSEACCPPDRCGRGNLKRTMKKAVQSLAPVPLKMPPYSSEDLAVTGCLVVISTTPFFPFLPNNFIALSPFTIEML